MRRECPPWNASSRYECPSFREPLNKEPREGLSGRRSGLPPWIWPWLQRFLPAPAPFSGSGRELGAPAPGYHDVYRSGGAPLTGHTVDILINQQIVESGTRTTDVPGSYRLYSNDDVKFNVCRQPTTGNKDLRNYELMVHEAGHALGLSGFSWAAIAVEKIYSQAAYEMAHPTILDSVMNYNPNIQEGVRHPARETLYSEPDCSPHPFDIMVIYALYQHVR